MTVQVATLREILLGGWDLTGQHQEDSEVFEIDELPANVYGGVTKIKEPGLITYGRAGAGFWNGGDDEIDDVLFDQKRVNNLLFSALQEDGSVGSKARFVQAMIAEYQFSAAHGELLKVTYALGAGSTPVDGVVMHNASATGNVTGTGVQHGAVTAGQSLYAGLHVFSGSGNLDVLIESDDNGSFTSATTRITFAQVDTGTARSYEWATPVAGAITDDWWRITATNPATRDFAVVLGIH